ncbi:MAG: Glycosyltransferase involved in cell wall [Nitrospira sp.]|nr:MAG: Glycosyltransferase involved in cell wall [Nitrospira sp.]
MNDHPLVSVVIPTVNRPQLVVRAVRSALAQTLQSIEVVVVIDGPDEKTEKVLAALDESRLLVKLLLQSQGAAQARNAGVGAARSQWIAFLDDDDEWHPRKLEVQLRAAQQSTFKDPIIACRFIKRSDIDDVVLPRRLPVSGEPMSEYLFRRTRLCGGEGLVQTSTVFTTKNLLQTVPFRAEARRHDDLDWLVRATARGERVVEFAPFSEPLAIWHRPEHLETMSSRKDWRFSLSWAQRNRQLMTSQAYASFLLTWLSANAIEQGDRSAFWPLLKNACRFGASSVLDACVFAGIWLMPQGLRRWLAGKSIKGTA